MRAFAPHAAWTSAATHAVLPLLATTAGLRLQLETGIAAHRARFGAWRGGLLAARVRATRRGSTRSSRRPACTPPASTSPTCSGTAPPAQLRPLRTGAGPLLVPIDRAIMDLVWHAAGYPSHGAYRNTRRYTEHRHTPWAVDGAPYDPARAAAQVARRRGALRRRRSRGGSSAAALCVCALDTELLGHFWHEGVAWLAAVVEACDRAGVALAGLDDALAEEPETAPAPAGLPPTSWGDPRDLTHLERPGRRRSSRGARAAAELRRARRRRAARPARARCASCSRCRPPTGRSA